MSYLLSRRNWLRLKISFYSSFISPFGISCPQLLYYRSAYKIKSLKKKKKKKKIKKNYRLTCCGRLYVGVTAWIVGSFALFELLYFDGFPFLSSFSNPKKRSRSMFFRCVSSVIILYKYSGRKGQLFNLISFAPWTLITITNSYGGHSL